MSEEAMSRSAIKHIGILVSDGVVLADVVSIADIFGILNKLNAATSPECTHYQLSMLSTSGGMIMTSIPLQIMTEPIAKFNNIHFDTLFVMSGTGAFDAYRDPKLISWLQKKRDDFTSIVALCTGVLVVAATGLLDNRRATTHWSLFDKFEREFPLINLVKQEQTVVDAPFYTSCDVGMAVTLTLKLLEDRLGTSVVQQISNNLVVCQRRRDTTITNRVADQTELVINSKIHKASIWFAEHLDESITIMDAANFVSMSERNFTRQFKKETGQTPHDFLLNLRLEAVMQQLMETDLPVDKIARRCGLFSGAQVAKLFRKHLLPCPTEYRKQLQNKIGRIPVVS